MPGLTRLVEGYRRFRAYGWKAQHDRWQELAQGQSPKVFVISCCDSRVDPTRIFDTSPGEMFVVRNVANLVPPNAGQKEMHSVLAALEFGVTQLNIPDILVIGHARCGGAQAALSRQFDEAHPGEGGYLANWLKLLDGARERVRAQYGDGPEASQAMEFETVRVSLTNLMSFPFIKERVDDGRLKLHGAYFSIAEGILHIMDENGAFKPA